MSWNANESTIKFAQACIDKDLDTVHNLLRIDKEKIDVKQLNEVETLIRILNLDSINVFDSLEELKEAIEKDPHVQIVKLLCEIGVDLEQKDHHGRTALHLAIRGNKMLGAEFHENPRIVKTLLEHGASAHAKDRNGRTPLHNACV